MIVPPLIEMFDTAIHIYRPNYDPFGKLFLQWVYAFSHTPGYKFSHFIYNTCKAYFWAEGKNIITEICKLMISRSQVSLSN